MTEARRLLERLRAPGASGADKVRVYRDIDAYLAQPMTTGMTEEEEELLEWHSPKSGWWMGEKRDDLCQGCSGRPIEGCVTRKVIFSLAESRAREGELVAALEGTGRKVLCGEWHQPDCPRYKTWRWIERTGSMKANDTECSPTCVAARAALAQGEKE